MTTVMDDERVAERVGTFDFTIEQAEERPETKRRWDRRVDALAAWLLEEWRREHAEAN